MLPTAAAAAAAVLLATLTLARCAPTKSTPRASWSNKRHPRTSDSSGGGLLEARNSTWMGPREEAHALCSVRTPEGNATANVTITRRLHGVLTSREMHTAMKRLELIVHGQMQQLWQALDAIRTQLAAAPLSPTAPAASYPDRNKFLYQYYVPAAG